MKKIMSILFTITFLTTASAQDVTVESISNLDPNVEFESYAFMDGNQVWDQSVGENPGDGVLQDQELSTTNQNTTMNGYNYSRDWATLNPIESAILKEAITYQFDVEGLEMKTDDPDVFVQYHIYTGEYSEDDSYTRPADDGAGVAGATGANDNAYRQKQAMMDRIENGTVVLSVVDAEEGRSVWEGFAFNAYEEGATVREKQIGLRQAVDALVSQFLADNDEMTGMGTGVTR